MAKYTKVSIILKDADSHMDYNRRIIEYLNDRHMDINDNFYTIAIELADDSNINEYAREGMESLPALRVSDGSEFVYGVNSILAMLAKLEIPTQPIQSNSTSHEQMSVTNQYSSMDDSSDNAFYKMTMEEMQSKDQEDGTEPSTIKAYNQDLLETPLTEKMIEEKAKAYSQMYEDRRKRNSKMAGHRTSKPAARSNKPTPGGINVDKFIQDGKFDKGEEMLMREIAQNLR